MRVAISTAWLATYLHRKYADLAATVSVMKALARERVVDGFEFELLAEWDPRSPPVEKDAKYDRKFEWEASHKYPAPEIADILGRSGLPILAVHANRDIGLLLCSGGSEQAERAATLIQEALTVASEVGSDTCVFHLWDPWSASVDYARLRTLLEQATRDSRVRAAVENIPTYTPEVSPFEAVRDFEWIALDLKWALHYHELERFRSLLDRIAEVHVHVGLVRHRAPSAAAAHGEGVAALRTLVHDWGYTGVVTLETDDDFSHLLWSELVGSIGAFARVA